MTGPSAESAARHQMFRPQISGLSPDCGPGPVRPQIPSHSPRPRPRLRPLAPAPGPWQATGLGPRQAQAPGTCPSQGRPRIPGPQTLALRPPAATPRLAKYGTSLHHKGAQGEPGPAGYSPHIATPRPPQDKSPFHYGPQARRPYRAIGPSGPTTTSSHIHHRGLAARPMAGRPLQSRPGQVPGQAPEPGPEFLVRGKKNSESILDSKK